MVLKYNMAERFIEIDRETGVIYAGDHILENPGISGLLDSESAEITTGGRRNHVQMRKLTELPITSPESSDADKPLELWNHDLTKDDIQGF